MELVRQAYRVREFRGYALNFAAQIEASSPQFILRLLQASNLSRQVFFAASAEIHLDRPEVFLAQIEAYAPDVLADLGHLDPLAQVARALILMKPRRTIQVLYGECPDGFLGLLSRLGCDPLDKETYRNAFELFADPRHRQRAKVLGQLPGRINAEHIAVVAGLDDTLVHRVAVERAKPVEISALNAFVSMITDLCNATPASIRASLDKLSVGAKGVGMGEWAQGWLGRQVRIPFDPPIPVNDPNFKLCIGVELTSLGRRLRNCAGQRQSYTLLGERLVYEIDKPGEQAALELIRLTTGDQTHWACEDLRASRNKRVSPELAAWVQAKLDEFGILYQCLKRPTAEEQALHKLVDHTTPFAWDMRREEEREEEDDAGGDAAIERMLEELEQEIDHPEAA